LFTKNIIKELPFIYRFQYIDFFLPNIILLRMILEYLIFINNANNNLIENKYNFEKQVDVLNNYIYKINLNPEKFISTKFEFKTLNNN